MTENSLFVEVEFTEATSGFIGKFHGDKLYLVEYDSEIEKMVNDVLRIMRDKKASIITFVCFRGYDSVDLMRIVKDSGNEMTQVIWKRNTSFVSEVNTIPHIKINKRSTRKIVNSAIDMFMEYESK